MVHRPVPKGTADGTEEASRVVSTEVADNVSHGYHRVALPTTVGSEAVRHVLQELICLLPPHANGAQKGVVAPYHVTDEVVGVEGGHLAGLAL